MATTFDPIAFKATTKQQWEDAAGAWHLWGPFLEEWLGDATERMLDHADIRPGSAVLDVAAGAGGQTLAAARRVGTTGRVLATDISPTILTYAAKASAEAGFSVETLAIDGEELDVGGAAFDAAISRVGLIYFPDQQRALAAIRRALRPGGRFAAIVYSTAEHNRFFSLPVGIIRRRAALPAPLPGQPGPFSLGADGVIEAVMTEAGFRDVRVDNIDAPVRLSSSSECVRFDRESFGALHTMLANLDIDAREEAWEEIATALAVFDGADGFVGPCELIVASGTR